MRKIKQYTLKKNQEKLPPTNENIHNTKTAANNTNVIFCLTKPPIFIID